MNVAVSTESSTVTIPPGNGAQNLRDDDYRRRILNVQGKSMQYFSYFLKWSRKIALTRGCILFQCNVRSSHKQKNSINISDQVGLGAWNSEFKETFHDFSFIPIWVGYKGYTGYLP